MAASRFNIELTGQATEQLRLGILRGGARAFGGRVGAHAASIATEIGGMLVSAFEKSDVAKALRGQGSEDLPAHFGLSDGTAQSLVDGMAELIRSSVNISYKANPNGGSVRIQAVSRDWDRYLSLPGAQYLSRPSNVVVPVVEWLLVNPNIDIGQAAYDIVFKGEGSQFDARIEKVSRSGRAIMVSLDSLGGSGGYVLPSIVSGQSGQNFIEYTLGQQGVAKKAAAILVKRVK